MLSLLTNNRKFQWFWKIRFKLSNFCIAYKIVSFCYSYFSSLSIFCHQSFTDYRYNFLSVCLNCVRIFKPPIPDLVASYSIHLKIIFLLTNWIFFISYLFTLFLYLQYILFSNLKEMAIHYLEENKIYLIVTCCIGRVFKWSTYLFNSWRFNWHEKGGNVWKELYYFL